MEKYLKENLELQKSLIGLEITNAKKIARLLVDFRKLQFK